MRLILCAAVHTWLANRMAVDQKLLFQSTMRLGDSSDSGLLW